MGSDWPRIQSKLYESGDIATALETVLEIERRGKLKSASIEIRTGADGESRFSFRIRDEDLGELERWPATYQVIRDLEGK